MTEQGNNGRRRPRSIRRHHIRLYEANRLCEHIMSQVPGAAGYGTEKLPTALAEHLGRCDCGMIFNVMQACLMRLVSEAVVPPSTADSPVPSPPDDGRHSGPRNGSL